MPGLVLASVVRFPALAYFAGADHDRVPTGVHLPLR